jgi:hypothetical protein
MFKATSPPRSPLDTIPDPDRIRDRLSALFTEARLLRRLLKVAVDVCHERITEPDYRQEARHVN